MEIVSVRGIPTLNTTPLAEIRVKNFRITVIVDDVSEKRFELVFDTYQAMRLITADCYLVPENINLPARTVVEVLDSSWIMELKRNLKEIDETADFMERSRHFILPLQDNFLEVVAWNLEVTSS